jgi:predicted ATPase
MNDNQTKYIQRVDIKGFWERYDLDWQLNPDVNILVGENGTGKSSLLTLLNLVLNTVKADFSDKFITSESVVIYDNKDMKIFDGRVSLGRFAGTPPILRNVAQGGKHHILNIDYLTTFDMNLIMKSDERTPVKTFLDVLLKKALDEFTAYELRQTRKAARNEMTFAQALEKKNYLVSTINRLFKTTEKRVDDEQGDVAFRLYNGKKLSVYDLSAGEKQLLLILLTVIVQEEKPSVLLLDEPEISLHILWQHELITIIRTLNPNCQIILATHSLSLFTKNWRDKVTFMLGGQNGEKGILQPAKMPILA